MVEKPQISGAARVAAFLLSLDKASSTALMKHLDAEVLPEVAEALAAFEPQMAAPERIDELWRELAVQLHAPTGPRAPDAKELQELLRTAVGDKRAESVLADIRERRLHEQPFDELLRFSPELLSKALAQESASVAALVLAHLDPQLSGEIASGLPTEQGLDIVRRMATLKPPPFATLRAIAQDLLAALEAIAQVPSVPDAALQLRSIAEMLTSTTEEFEKGVLASLKEADAEMAKSIREFMFSWEDLATIDKRAMQRILGAVNTTALSIALKACQPEVEQNVLGNLSTRARAMVLEEKDMAGAVPMSQVLAAREEILTAVRGMLESGDLKLPRSGAAAGGDAIVS